MSNTVEYKGNVYEIGKVYEFSDDGKNWVASKLMCIIGSNYAFETCADNYKQIRSIEPSSIGTITKAPVKLEDGETYQFHYDTGNSMVLNFGIYRESRNIFECGIGVFVKHKCMKIVKLVPEVK